jgi:hypothetical protein
MDTNKKPWPIATVCGIQSQIDTNPDFQRPAVWGSSQKQLLIDTILRSYDVPKFYWRMTSKKPEKYEVIDGQQRLRAIWEFYAGKYALPKTSEPVDGYSIAGLKYQDLPHDLRIRFDTYALDVVIVQDIENDEVREMFLRLQNGTSLKAQEKRNAMPGNMRNFVKDLVKHPFFQRVGFANSRYAHDHVAAQLTLIELNGGPCNVKDANLNAMYKDEAEFDNNSVKAKKIKRVLDYLAKAFPEKTPELERFNVISLYTLVSHLLERYVIQERQTEIAKWFIDFEQYRYGQEQVPEEERDPDITVYHERISHSTDAEDSISWRHDFLMRKYFESAPDIELKDDQRMFGHGQRLAIYRRDKGYCQVKLKCDGVKCDWNNWEADHVKPWSKGGKTTVANGQVACLPCNSAKKDKNLS